MGNIYDEGINEIAERVRQAQSSGWEDFEIGIPLVEVGDPCSELNVNLELGDSLSEGDEYRLISSLKYCCSTISDLGISPSEAVWRKYYINFCTYAIPYSLALNEINRQAIMGGDFQEGIFDSIRSFSRRDPLTIRIRDEAILNAEAYYHNAKFPIGESNIGIIQLVLHDWLLKLGKEFTPSDIYQLLLSEVEELNNAHGFWDRAYEASDVIICILHMFSVYKINVAEVLQKPCYK